MKCVHVVGVAALSAATLLSSSRAVLIMAAEHPVGCTETLTLFDSWICRVCAALAVSPRHSYVNALSVSKLMFRQQMLLTLCLRGRHTSQA
jgi:hypothetical protein